VDPDLAYAQDTALRELAKKTLAGNKVAMRELAVLSKQFS
jgi:hypothetical protein